MRTHRLRTLVVAFVAGLGCLSLVACASPEERLAEHLQEGQRLLTAGQTDQAALHFRNALRIDPQHPQALLGMGRIFEQRQNFPRAYAAYRDAADAADADPALIEAHNAYAVLALGGGDLDVVRDAAASIRAISPDHPDGLALEAALALREERLDDARALAQRALEVDPGHVNATSALVGVVRATGDSDAAVEIIDQYFAAAGPNVPLALLKLQVLAGAGDVDGVEAAFRQLLEFDNDNVSFRLAFADFYRGLDNDGAAESVLRTAIDDLETAPAATVSLVRLVHQNRGLEPALAEIERLRGADAETDASLAFLAADILTSEERFDEARAQLEAVIETAGDGTSRAHDAMAALATVDNASGQPQAAEVRLEELVQQDPQHRGGNYLLAALQLQQDDVPAAVSSARAALTRDPDWPPALKLMAQAHLAAGDRDLAIDALRRAVQSAPDDVESASRLAQLLSQRGDYDTAMDVWDHVINQVPDSAGALSSTAEIAIRQQDWNRASTDIDRLLATPGAELSGTLLAGSLRLAQGDSEGAQQWFERAREIEPEGAAPLLGLVRSHLIEDDVNSALELLERRVAERPDDALAHSLLAQLHTQAERYEDAANAYRAAIAAQPQWGAPYRALATLEERAGRVDAALAVLDEGVAVGADTDGQLLLTKAFVQQRADRNEAALRSYATMLDAGDQRDLVVNNYAALVADFAYSDEDHFTRALDLAQRFEVSSEAYFLDTLGWLYYRQGEYARALAILRRAAALMPNDEHIRYHVGATLHALGETDAARQELDRALSDDADYVGVEHARSLLEQIEDSAPAG